MQQIFSSRFRTSAEADKVTVTLMGHLGLSTKASVARLSIGRSLAVGSLQLDAPDAKGLEIPAASMFSQQDLGVWIGLLKTHALLHDNSVIDSMDSLRTAIRGHWHRGALLLMEDWVAADDDYDKFLETLIVRRAELPDVSLQSEENKGETTKVAEQPSDLSDQLVKALRDIGVKAEVRGFTHGPRITRYNVFLPDVNQHTKLQRSLGKLGLSLNLQHRHPTLHPGEEAKTVSLDVPRHESTWEIIPFENLARWSAGNPLDDRLLVFPGVNVLGKPYSFDLANTPHLLVGGTTGSGKSVCLHAIILSLMMRFGPADLQLALIDPKQVEFAVYKGSNYLYGGDVATDVSAARERILELVAEMEARYDMFNAAGVTNISEARRRGSQLPTIVVMIEELADLVIQDDDIQNFIVRLAQKARAAGIHLVLATQRPDAKTFNGLIRSNIPARIALSVQKGTESKIILDDVGAENLLGMGDMLVKARPGAEPDRVHGILVSRTDIQGVLARRSAR